MPLKSYLWGIRMFTLVSFFSFFFVFFGLSPYVEQNPEQRTIGNILFFYFSLFCLLAGVFSLMLFGLRRKALVDLMASHLGVSLRQGILVSLIVVSLLALQAFRILTWWDASLAIGAVILIELFFLSRG